MAGGTPSGTIGTRISMDGSQPIETMKQLREAVKSLTNGWKAQEVELKSAGKYLDAAKARFDGLSESIKQQQTFITRLKTEQSGLDTSTKEGSTRFTELSNQINEATVKMGSMQGQLDRAKNSMNYYKSGIADLQSELKRTESVSASFVARLTAEGKASEAMKAKSDALHSSLSKMSELYTKQESELSRIANESGKGSDAYAKQSVRVDELGARMAKAQGEAKSLDATISREPHSWFGRVTQSAQRLTGQLNKTEDAGKKTGSVFGATFLGNAVANGVSALTSRLTDTAKQSIQLAQAGERASRAWETMGLSAKDVQLLQTQVGELRNKTGYSVDSVRALQKSFYGLTGNAKDTDQLTKSIVGMQSAAGLSENSLSRVGKQLGRMSGSANVSTQQFKRLTQLAPNMGNELAKAAGMSRKAFDEMVASGKLSGKELLDLSEKASNQADGNFKQLNKTSEGAINQIKGSWTSMKSEFGQKIVSVQTTGLGDLANIMQSPAMKGAVDSLAQGIAHIADEASKLIGYVSKHQADIGGIIGSLAQITKMLFSGAWSAVAGTINTIADAFGLLFGNAHKSTDPLKNLNRLLAGISKHQTAVKAVGAALIGAFATAKLMSGITGLAKGIGGVTAALKGVSDAEGIAAITQKALNVAMKANLFVAIAAAVVAVGVALFELYKHNEKFRDFINGIGKEFKKGFDGMVKVAKKSIDAIGKLFTGKLGWEQSLGKEAGKAGKAIKDGFASAIDWFKKNWKGVALLIVNPIAGGIKFLYDNNKGFKKWADSVISTIANALKPIGKVVGAIWDGLKKATKIAFEGIKIVALAPIVLLAATLVAAWKKIQKPMEVVWQAMIKVTKATWTVIQAAVIKPVEAIWKFISNVFGKIGKFVGELWGTVVKTTERQWAATGRAVSKPVNDVVKFVTNAWKGLENLTSRTWDGITKFVSNAATSIWRGVTKTFTTLGKDISNIWNNIQKWTSNTWNLMVSLVSKPVDAIWNKVTDVFGKLSDWISSTLSGIQKVWHNIWSDVSSFFSGIWDGIKSAAKSGIDGVIDFLNGGINGIDSVISFLGGDKKAISPIKRLATGTTNGRLNEDTIALLNDGHDSPETGNKEMIVKRDGRAGIIQGTNIMAHLDAGDAVVNAKDTKRVMNMMGIQKFANGSGWIKGIDSAVSWIGDKFDDVGKWIGDKEKAVEKFFKNPVGELTNVFDKFTSGIKVQSQLVADMAKPAGHYIIKTGESWFKKLFDKLNEDTNSPAGAMSKDAFKEIAEHAGELMHQSLSDHDISRLYWQAFDESGVNPATGGGVDDHDGTGLPVGLYQYKLGTWKAYQVGNHNNIHSALDQTMAVLNDSNWRSDLAPIGVRRGWSPSGHRMMANGGLISSHQFIEAGENNMAEMMIPLSTIKSSRGYELLGKTAATMAARDGMNGSSSFGRNDLFRLEQIAGRIEDALNVLVGFAYQNQNQPQGRTANAFDALLTTMQKRGQVLDNQNLVQEV